MLNIHPHWPQHRQKSLEVPGAALPGAAGGHRTQVPRAPLPAARALGWLSAASLPPLPSPAKALRPRRPLGAAGAGQGRAAPPGLSARGSPGKRASCDGPPGFSPGGAAVEGGRHGGRLGPRPRRRRSASERAGRRNARRGRLSRKPLAARRKLRRAAAGGSAVSAQPAVQGIMGPSRRRRPRGGPAVTLIRSSPGKTKAAELPSQSARTPSPGNAGLPPSQASQKRWGGS